MYLSFSIHVTRLLYIILNLKRKRMIHLIAYVQVNCAVIKDMTLTLEMASKNILFT